MEKTIFAKKRTNREGKPFYSYLTTMRKKDGTEEIMQVRFRDECGAPEPKKCPINIVFDKSDANVAKRSYIREDTGEPAIALTLWITAWKEGEPYVDTSMDDYE